MNFESFNGSESQSIINSTFIADDDTVQSSNNELTPFNVINFESNQIIIQEASIDSVQYDFLSHSDTHSSSFYDVPTSLTHFETESETIKKKNLNISLKPVSPEVTNTPSKQENHDVNEILSEQENHDVKEILLEQENQDVKNNLSKQKNNESKGILEDNPYY